MANIKDQERDFIICQENQKLWAILNIDERCVMFHRKFPSRRIKKFVMLKVMKQAGLRKKKVHVSNVPARKE